ncbi:hypothetical protein KRP22_013031 [Phytophthora ramorum]|nr:hypothetical protein KRP22_8537 [Phytophthora ramorum]
MWKALFGSICKGSLQCVMELLYPSVILNNPIEGRADLTVLKDYHSTPLSDNGLPPLHAVGAQDLATLTHHVSNERLALVAKSGFPIFIIGSKQDILMPPPKNILELVEHLKGEHVQTLFFETGGHGAPIQFMEEIAAGLVQTMERTTL